MTWKLTATLDGNTLTLDDTAALPDPVRIIAAAKATAAQPVPTWIPGHTLPASIDPADNAYGWTVAAALRDLDATAIRWEREPGVGPLDPEIEDAMNDENAVI